MTLKQTMSACMAAGMLLLLSSCNERKAGFTVPDTDGWTRTQSTQRQSEFPKVNASGEYWFRFKAPSTARDVKLEFAGQTFQAAQDEEGLWNVVCKAPKVGYQIVRLIIDGVSFNDPGVDATYCNGWTSTLEVPSPSDSYYLMRDVPHGDVREHWFWSDVEGKWRRAYVYTPAEYDANPGKKYPVLYLQHGAGENETEWTHTGYAAVIADNMIADGEAEPLIIVMNNDFVYRPGDGRGRLALADDWAGNFEEMFFNEAIPSVESKYRIKADPSHRAMAGLSLGGMLTAQVGLKHSSFFSYYGIFSGGVVADPDALDKTVVKHVMMTCGEEENPQRLYDNEQLCKSKGVSASVYVSPGTAHEWQTWRRSLHEFLPLLKW